MQITRKSNGCYKIASLPDKQEFSTLRIAMAAVRHMGGKPVFVI